MEQQTPPAEDGVTDGLHIVGYSVNEQGKYELVSGPGWQPVNTVNRQAWLEIEKQIESAKKKTNRGRVSPLYYYMIANQMNIGLLAGYTRQSRLRVRLHLIPFFFKRLHRKTLKKYSDIFRIAPNDLKNGRLKRPAFDSTRQGQPGHD